MRFALCRAVARCQARRLVVVGATAPLPSVILVSLVALAPFALARAGETLGGQLSGTVASSEVATALVLGPCLAAAAVGAILAVSLPTRAGLGPQIGAGPCSDRSAVGAGVLLPAVLATLIVMPSLLAVSISLAGAFPGGRLAGLSLAVAILAAVPAGAVVAEGAQIAMRGHRIRLIAIGVGLVAWIGVGGVMGAAPLGLLASVSLAFRGMESAWIALAEAGVAAAGLGVAWFLLAASRPERRSRGARRRRSTSTWRFPVPAAVSSLVLRRSDVRHATGAAIAFGVVGAMVAVASGAQPPGPFLLATTTTLLGSLVAALAGWGVLRTGAWLWLGAPRGRTATATTVWHAGLVAAAAPVAFVAVVATVASGVDWSTVGVVVVLVVSGTAVATVGGSLVPWQGDGLGDQAGPVAAFASVAVASSLVVGFVAPRLGARGVPDPAIAVLLCVSLSCIAVGGVVRRLEIGGR